MSALGRLVAHEFFVMVWKEACNVGFCRISMYLEGGPGELEERVKL
jgi:hypothetical protein